MIVFTLYVSIIKKGTAKIKGKRKADSTCKQTFTDKVPKTSQRMKANDNVKMIWLENGLVKTINVHHW